MISFGEAKFIVGAGGIGGGLSSGLKKLRGENIFTICDSF